METDIQASNTKQMSTSREQWSHGRNFLQQVGLERWEEEAIVGQELQDGENNHSVQGEVRSLDREENELHAGKLHGTIQTQDESPWEDKVKSQQSRNKIQY